MKKHLFFLYSICIIMICGLFPYNIPFDLTHSYSENEPIQVMAASAGHTDIKHAKTLRSGTSFQTKAAPEGYPRNLMNPAEQLDALHIQNFFNAIRKSEPLHSDITSGHKSTLLVQLGNIAQRVGHSLNIDNQNGRIMYDNEAMKYWSRSYEPGWEMKL